MATGSGLSRGVHSTRGGSRRRRAFGAEARARAAEHGRELRRRESERGALYDDLTASLQQWFSRGCVTRPEGPRIERAGAELQRRRRVGAAKCGVNSQEDPPGEKTVYHGAAPLPPAARLGGTPTLRLPNRARSAWCMVCWTAMRRWGQVFRGVKPEVYQGCKPLFGGSCVTSRANQLTATRRSSLTPWCVFPRGEQSTTR